jgi:hypothetical protein
MSKSGSILIRALRAILSGVGSRQLTSNRHEACMSEQFNDQ